MEDEKKSKVPKVALGGAIVGTAAGTLGSLAAYGAIKGIKKLAKRKTT